MACAEIRVINTDLYLNEIRDEKKIECIFVYTRGKKKRLVYSFDRYNDQLLQTIIVWFTLILILFSVLGCILKKYRFLNVSKHLTNIFNICLHPQFNDFFLVLKYFWFFFVVWYHHCNSALKKKIVWLCGQLFNAYTNWYWYWPT